MAKSIDFKNLPDTGIIDLSNVPALSEMELAIARGEIVSIDYLIASILCEPKNNK